MANTIKLKNYINVFEEYKAHEALYPGHLLFLNSDNEVALHAVADGAVLPMFALEDESQGRGIDAVYTAADPVQVWIPTRGDIVNAILKDGETIVIGDLLTSAAGGELQKYDVAASAGVYAVPNAIVGVAVTELNLGSSSTTTLPAARIQVRII